MPDDQEELSPTPPPTGIAPAGEVRYVVQDSIGHGGMGQVFRAWDQNLGRQVAIKRISEDPGVDAAIRREAGILAALHHPNIVTIFDFAADDQGPFVVMELVEGRNLDEIVAGQPLEVSSFLELVSQICRGLSSAHAAGLLHLDLKPGNIMLQLHRDGSFTSKILDFGLARAREEGDDTGDGEIYGSPYTVSPEQLNRRPVDARADIYSLGCVFYYALSGKNAFEAPTVDDILRRHMDGVTTPLHLIAPKVPKAMSLVIATMLSTDPAARPQSVEEVRTQLLKASRAPVPAQAVAPPAHLPGRGRSPGGPARKEGGGVFVALALLVLGGAGAWWYLGGKHTEIGEDTSPPVPSQNPSTSADTEAGGENKPTIDPADLAALAQHAGQPIIIEGTVESAGESGLFHAEFLRFTGVPKDGAVVSVRGDVIGAEQIQSFVGKRVRATGKLSEAAGVKRVVVESAAQLTVIPPQG